EETTTTESTTTAPDVPTGDAGVALAFAGLLTAAATAVVVRKKRK
ncbi:MAG: NPXTG-anchored protein, partial [Oscillospiraceae bacterium]|nr:NPXTG-anchored protein [Oscillospiraceae bacterium]MBR6762091.1 NPXTG-anchored protein [Oscillospiraceae bacterium]